MTHSPIINGQIRAGVWQGEIPGHDADPAPQITVTHNGTDIAGVSLRFDDTRSVWRIEVPIPQAAINDGLQTFVIKGGQAAPLGHFSILAGDGVPDDLTAQVNLLRAELDLLKAAFRKHCIEA